MLKQSGSQFNLPLLFCSIQTLNKLDDAHRHCVGPLALLSPPIQVLVLRNTLTDIPQNNVYPVNWASFCPVKLKNKMNHYNCSLTCSPESGQAISLMIPHHPPHFLHVDHAMICLIDLFLA